MKYFLKLNYSVDAKVTGLKNGLSQAYLLEDKIKSNWKKDFITPKDNWPNLELNNICTSNQELFFQLRNNAKLTDLIVITPYIYNSEYLVSEKLFQILQKSKLNFPIFKKVILKLDNEIRNDYYLFQSKSIEVDNVNWTESTFYDPLDYLFGEKKLLTFEDYQDYMKYCQTHLPLKINEVSILSEEKFDLIIIDEMDTFVTVDLLKELKRNEISNIEYPS